ncbi:hypothetical protein GPJ56_006789 [Histomonas meleagridis]|uniref:uncharacterized protein n=1 Tax=Histomonas meleagridis TaxID=135588 RepID=UPI00355A8A93|nr:hypothetical protein GPJ56_006789 [Histomonas meleagridis]KAH0800198.1 hypothetical protein GO595_007310 [Histomonas meleagridis]
MSSVSKKKILANINSVVENARSEVKHYRREIKHYRKFMNNLELIVEHEVPEFSPRMKQITERFYSSINSEERFIDAYERMAEDFNDIAARFTVLYRASMASIEARNHYKERCTKYEKQKEEVRILSEKGSSKRIKAEAELAKDKEKKANVLAEAIKKDEELLVIQDRFSKFKSRRLKHAYTFLAKEMRATMTQILEDNKAIKALCSENPIVATIPDQSQTTNEQQMQPQEQPPQYASYQPPPTEVSTNAYIPQQETYAPPEPQQTYIPPEPQQTYIPPTQTYTSFDQQNPYDLKPNETYTSLEPPSRSNDERPPEESYMFVPTFD